MPRPAIDPYYIQRQQRAKNGTTKLWQAMRILRRFTVHELMAVCERSSRRAVLCYCSRLRRAGFIKVVDPGHQGRHIPQTFAIVRNTGPLAPALLQTPAKRAAVMFDPNTREEHPFESAN